MDLTSFARRCGSASAQRQALLALEDKALRSLITPAGAVAFGAVPIATIDRHVVFASVPDAHPACERALGMALREKVKTLPFEDGLVRGAIAHYYLRGREDGPALDLETFDTPDFLEDPSCAGRLLRQKPAVSCDERIGLNAQKIGLLDLRMHSVMRSLDRKHGIEFVAAPSSLGFRLVPDGALLLRDHLPSAKVRAIISQSVFYDGAEHIHAMVHRDLESLPHVVHPSEMQLVGLDELAAVFWVYDSRQSVEPGRTASWEARYWFLQFGGRLERRLRLDVLAFAVMDRERLALATGQVRFEPEDLGRLFGLDFSRS